MDKHELAKRLMATFLEELHEHVDAMNRDLLALEKKPRPEERAEVLKLLFRSFHSLKGASQAVNVGLIEHSCHIMEDILAEVRDGKREMSPQLFTLFFRVADGIQEVGMRLRDEEDFSDSPLNCLIPELEQATRADDPAVIEPVETVEAQPVRRVDVDAESVAKAVASMRDAAMPAEESPASVVPPTPTHSMAKPEPPRKDAVTVAGSVRVPAEKLDTLLAQSGELLVARRRIEQRSSDARSLFDKITDLRSKWNLLAKPLQGFLEDFGNDLQEEYACHSLPRRSTDLLKKFSEQLDEIESQLEQHSVEMANDARALRQTCDALDDEVYRVRMLPFAEACGGLDRAVRDIATATGKEVELVLEGEDVEVDRSVLEGLKDPLMHLIRNAVDHGIEPPEARQAAGKPRQGRITVSAELQGGHVEVMVADDGRGFDLKQICEKGKQRGISIPEGERDQLRMIFLSGFSTAEIVTDVSGRGVGLDVVESAVQKLRGAIDVDFRAGEGSRFVMTVPLTLTTVRCVLVNVAGHTYAIPTSSVQLIERFDTESVQEVAGRDVLFLKGIPTPLTGLGEMLFQTKARQSRESGKWFAAVVGTVDRRVAFVVDELVAEQEVLVKNLGARIRQMRHVSGATVLPSGRVALVLNATNVVKDALEQGPKIDLAAPAPTEDHSQQRRYRLLVVDDSVTTRMMLKAILESENFDVMSAADGEQAWEVLADNSFDLIVCDVDMPRMNGFELTSKIRESSKFEELPVVLVTARATDEDKTRGVQAGANAYIVKGGFDQNALLETIHQLI